MLEALAISFMIMNHQLALTVERDAFATHVPTRQCEHLTTFIFIHWGGRNQLVNGSITSG